MLCCQYEYRERGIRKTKASLSVSTSGVTVVRQKKKHSIWVWLWHWFGSVLPAMLCHFQTIFSSFYCSSLCSVLWCILNWTATLRIPIEIHRNHLWWQPVRVGMARYHRPVGICICSKYCHKLLNLPAASCIYPPARLNLLVFISLAVCVSTLCFKKRGVELFAITSSVVNQFWKFFHCWWKQKWIIYKIKITILASPWKPCCTTVWNIQV